MSDRLSDSGEHAAARARIAAQQGRLHGWRPLAMGDNIVVVAVQVLGMAPGVPPRVGLRVIVAARDADQLAARSHQAAELALRKRGVLEPEDAFEVAGNEESSGSERQLDPDDPLTWPYVSLIVDVPEERLPAIAGLTTDRVYG